MIIEGLDKVSRKEFSAKLKGVEGVMLKTSQYAKGYKEPKNVEALEIAESFINGNISWVKERTKGKKAFLAFRQYIAPDDLESYDRICGKDN